MEAEMTAGVPGDEKTGCRHRRDPNYTAAVNIFHSHFTFLRTEIQDHLIRHQGSAGAPDLIMHLIGHLLQV